MLIVNSELLHLTTAVFSDFWLLIDLVVVKTLVDTQKKSELLAKDRGLGINSQYYAAFGTGNCVILPSPRARAAQKYSEYFVEKCFVLGGVPEKRKNTNGTKVCHLYAF